MQQQWRTLRIFTFLLVFALSALVSTTGLKISTEDDDYLQHIDDLDEGTADSEELHIEANEESEDDDVQEKKNFAKVSILKFFFFLKKKTFFHLEKSVTVRELM